MTSELIEQLEVMRKKLVVQHDLAIQRRDIAEVQRDSNLKQGMAWWKHEVRVQALSAELNQIRFTIGMLMDVISEHSDIKMF